MEVLTLQQAGFLAWSKSKKTKSLFASASIYDSFSAPETTQEDALLQIYSFDIVNKTSSSQKMGVATYQGAHFTSLDWETFGETESYPYGIIAAGFDNGVVGLWDPNYIIQNSSADSSVDVNQRGLISLQEVHENSPVNTIAFNPFKQHLIASGGTEVAIHNLEKDIAEPDVYFPGSEVHQGSPITSVSWNRKVPHILGSASQNGISVVWDLKLHKSIFNFSDPSRSANNRNVCLSWNPEIPTQIAVVYDDAKAPELQIWDLRNPKGPIFCTMKGHTKGIHFLDWSVTDPSLIITTGRDNKVCIWNYKLGSDNLVSEFALDEPATQVKWSPRQPEIYSVSNPTGNSTIYSLNNQLDHIPAWIRPPVGARFSFDGRLAAFSEKGGANIREYKVKITDENMEPYIAEFEQNFTNKKADLETLCQNRIHSELLEDKERQEWLFMHAVVKNDHDEIIEALGFNKEQILKKAENYTGKYYITKPAKAHTQKTESNFKHLDEKDAENFFDILGKKGSKDAAGKMASSLVDIPDDYAIQETIVKNTNWNAGKEKIIKENILIGNIEGAVDSALQCGRVAEALLLAFAKGDDFFRSTIKSYVTSTNDPFVKNVIRYLVEDQIEELVRTYSLDDWKECVALCISLSQKTSSNFKNYMEQLATRFIHERNDHETALLCYILSKNFLRILETFASSAEKLEKGSFQHTVFLMNTIEKISALKIIVNYHEPNSLVDRFLYDLAKALHPYNRDLLILTLISTFDSFGFECLVLKDRILNSSSEFQQMFQTRGFPFPKEAVHIKAKKNNFEGSGKKVGPGPVGRTTTFDTPKTGINQGPGNSNPLTNKPQPGVRPPFGNKPPGGPSDNIDNTGKPLRDQGPTKTLFDPTKKKDDMLPPPIKPNTGFGGVPPKKDLPFGEAPRPFDNVPNSVSSSRSDFQSTNKGNPFEGNSQGTRPGFDNNPGPVNTIGGQVKPVQQGGQPPKFTGPPKPSGPVRTGPIGAPIGNSGTGPINGPGTISGPTGGPMGGPIGGPRGGPIGGPIGGPTGGPIGGPIGGPMGGSMGGPMGGPTGPSRGNQLGGGVNPTGSFAGGPPSGTTNVLKNNPGGFGEGPSRPNPPSGMPMGGVGGRPGMPGPTGGYAPSKPVMTNNPPTQNQDKPLDGSQVPSNYQHIYDSVMRGLETLEQIDQNPRKKAENEQKMQTLFTTLAAGDMKPVTMNDLNKLCAALDQGNLQGASILQQKIAREDYMANKEWLYVMRRIVQGK